MGREDVGTNPEAVRPLDSCPPFSVSSIAPSKRCGCQSSCKHSPEILGNRPDIGKISYTGWLYGRPVFRLGESGRTAPASEATVNGVMVLPTTAEQGPGLPTTYDPRGFSEA